MGQTKTLYERFRELPADMGWIGLEKGAETGEDGGAALHAINTTDFTAGSTDTWPEGPADRESVQAHIAQRYGVDAEFPWVKYPEYAVFRRPDNRKWFAVLLNVPKVKMGIEGEGALDILNVKCDPILAGSLRQAPGFYPGYHMNKENWISAALDGSVDGGLIGALLEESYDRTAPKRRTARTKDRKAGNRGGKTDGRK